MATSNRWTTETSHEFRLYCLDKKTGKICGTGWRAMASKNQAPHSNPRTRIPPATTDGQRVIASFGSEGLYCFDMAGKLLWKKDLGLFDRDTTWFPRRNGGLPPRPCSRTGASTCSATCRRTRSSPPSTPGTAARSGGRSARMSPPRPPPTLYRSGGKTLLIVNGYKQIAAYEAGSGKEAWRLTGGGDIPVPTPIASGGLIYITNAHGRNGPRYMRSRERRRAISRSNPTRPPARTSRGSKTAAARTCRLPSSTATTSTCAATRAYDLLRGKDGRTDNSERLGTGRTGFTASGAAADGSCITLARRARCMS